MTNRQSGVLIIGYTVWFFLFRWLISLYPSLGVLKTYRIFYLVLVVIGLFTGIIVDRRQNLTTLVLSLPPSLAFLGNLIFEEMNLLRTEYRAERVNDFVQTPEAGWVELAPLIQSAKMELIKLFLQGLVLMVLGVVLANLVCILSSRLRSKRMRRYYF